jgi:hypothetical protein
MRTRYLLFASVLAAANLAAGPATLAAPVQHGEAVLFVARLEGSGAAAPQATATGAFVLHASRTAARLDYRITYDGLPAAPTAVYLRNAGAGAAGPVVHVLCGRRPEGGAAPCPAASGGTLTGQLGLRGPLVRELAVQRMTLEFAAGPGDGALQATLQPNAFMVMAAEFRAPLQGERGGPTGTGAFRLLRFGDGREVLQYDVTVTGGGPVRALEFALPGGVTTVTAVERRSLLLTADSAARQGGGATLRGAIVSDSGPNLLRLRGGAVKRLLSRGELTVRVTTSRSGVVTGRVQPVN